MSVSLRYDDPTSTGYLLHCKILCVTVSVIHIVLSSFCSGMFCNLKN